MKNEITKYHYFKWYEYDLLKMWLLEQIEEGLHPVSVSQFSATFVKQEISRDRRYIVIWSNKFNNRTHIAEMGWNRITCAIDNILIFY